MPANPFRAVLPGLAAVTLMFSSTTQAAFVTSDTISNPTVLAFSQFTGASQIVGASGSIQVGTSVGEDILFTTLSATGLYAWNGNWSVFEPGGGISSWNSGRDGYIGAIDARPGTLVLHFANAVAEVGALLNYSKLDSTASVRQQMTISVYDDAHTLLESYDVTGLADILPGDGALNVGGFRGVKRSASDISYFEVTAYVPALDDLTFSRSSVVSEPASLALLAAAVAMAAGTSRANRRSEVPRRHSL